MSEDTVVLPASLHRAPNPALMPSLIIALLACLAVAGYFFVQAGHSAEALDTAQSQLASLRSKIDQQQQRIESLERQIATQEAQLASNAQVPLPVDVTFAAARTGQGLVARFQNFANSDLALAVKPRRSDGTDKGEFTLKLPVHGLIELGQAEGWAFQSGDTLSVKAGSYLPLALRVP